MDTRATISRARARLRAPAWARLLAAALVAVGLQCPAASQAGCQLQVLELPVKMVGHRAIATVGINGTPVPLIVDSGGFFSMLTEAAAAQLNLRLKAMPQRMEVYGLAGKVRTRLTTVEHMQLLKGEIPDVDFIVGGNEPGGGAMGLMGRNILSFTDTEYDFAHGMVRFVFPNDECEHRNMAYWAGDTPVAELSLRHDYREPNPEIRAEVKVNGHDVTATFDSGASSLVSLGTAHHVGIKDSDMTPEQQGAGVGTDRMNVWNAHFDEIDLGGESVRNNRLEVADFSINEEMLIGFDFFLSHRIYVSKKQSKMFFTYNGGPIFALNNGDRADHDAGKAGAAALTADELARRGAASLSRGDLDGALADLDRACTLEPTNADFLVTRADIHLARKHRDKSLADLDAALLLDPAHDQARIQRAELNASRKETAKVLEDLTTLDKRLAPQSEIRRSIASIYDRLEMPAQALPQWNLWIAAHKHDIGLDSAYNSRCWGRMELGIELDKALADCDEAVDANDKDASFIDSRAWVYLRMGKPQKAMSDFNRGLAIKADLASSLYGRGLVHLALGETSAAQADLAAARKAQPDIDDSMRKAGLPVAPDTPAAKP